MRTIFKISLFVLFFPIFLYSMYLGVDYGLNNLGFGKHLKPYQYTLLRKLQEKPPEQTPEEDQSETAALPYSIIGEKETDEMQNDDTTSAGGMKKNLQKEYVKGLASEGEDPEQSIYPFLTGTFALELGEYSSPVEAQNAAARLLTQKGLRTYFNQKQHDHSESLHLRYGLFHDYAQAKTLLLSLAAAGISSKIVRVE